MELNLFLAAKLNIIKQKEKLHLVISANKPNATFYNSFIINNLRFCQLEQIIYYAFWALVVIVA